MSPNEQSVITHLAGLWAEGLRGRKESKKTKRRKPLPAELGGGVGRSYVDPSAAFEKYIFGKRGEEAREAEMPVYRQSIRF